MFRWCATYSWKSFKEGYKFVINLISIGGLHKKCWASKVVGVPILGILGLPNLEFPRQNDIWVQAPWPNTKNTIRGKVVASAKFRLW